MGHLVTHFSGFLIANEKTNRQKMELSHLKRRTGSSPQRLRGPNPATHSFPVRLHRSAPLTLQAGNLVPGFAFNVFPNYAKTLVGPWPIFNIYQHLTL